MWLTHRRFNDVLSLTVLALAFYLLFAPLLPQLSFWLKGNDQSSRVPYSGVLASEVGGDTDAPLPKNNRIVIPAIDIDEPIASGNSISVINDGGTWFRPNTVEPGSNGNSVIVGHRFFRGQASTFYHLDKVSVGDKIGVYWEGEETVYQVFDTQVVSPDQGWVEADIFGEQLTLYTCTPLWTASDRLVIFARPIENKEDKVETVQL